MPTRDSPRLSPLERYLQILEIVAASSRGLTMTDIAEMAPLPKASVHRLTRTLLDAGLLCSDPDNGKLFRAGARLSRLLYLSLGNEAVVNFAQIVCNELVHRLNETCYLVRLEHAHVRSVARAVPEQGYRLHVVPGAELPPHAASSAKAILAFQEEKVVRRVLREPLARLTSRTKTRMSDCLAELTQVRRLGYAVCDREIDENVIAYAAPVRLPESLVLFSIGVTGPVSRLRRHETAYYVAQLSEAAAKFARMLQTASQ